MVYFIGKPRDAHANAMAAEYLKRASRWLTCQMREIDPKRLQEPAHPAFRVALDPAGQLMSSDAFAAFLARRELEGRDVVFYIGGADGLPEQFKHEADLLLSLGPMTLPHELARVVLAEQIYRALASMRGHPYPR